MMWPPTDISAPWAKRNRSFCPHHLRRSALESIGCWNSWRRSLAVESGRCQGGGGVAEVAESVVLRAIQVDDKATCLAVAKDDAVDVTQRRLVACAV